VRSHAAWALGQLGGAGARAALEPRRKAESDPEVRMEIEAALAPLP
jgi:epoxyqueuosine reductase